jgi:CBS domain-containing protein
LGCVLVGLAAGALSALLTVGVYAAEDAFQKLPIHWMWWPAIGGVCVGIGGLIFPPALGVGYDNIHLLLRGNVALTFLLGVLLVKSSIWMISLGSGTSGGVLAPLLMMGAALGGVAGIFLPHFGLGFWPLVGMGAILGGTMRSPFTGIVFALELTHDFNMLLPLMVANFLAHGFTVLVLKRSILTEKISRRGFHLTREYATDPLEILFVREVMRTSVVALPASETLERTRELIRPRKSHGQHLFPVITGEGQLVGVISRNHALRLYEEASSLEREKTLGEIVPRKTTVAHSDESLRVVVYRMAETGFTRLPVVDEKEHLVGMVSLDDLLQARTRNLQEERARERVLRLRTPIGARAASERVS